MKFMLCGAQMLFGFYAVSPHVVVVGGSGNFHLVNRFLHVVVARFQVMPVMNALGNGDAGNKRQARGENGNGDRLLRSLVFPSQGWISLGVNRTTSSPNSDLRSK